MASKTVRNGRGGTTTDDSYPSSWTLCYLQGQTVPSADVIEAVLLVVDSYISAPVRRIQPTCSQNPRRRKVGRQRLRLPRFSSDGLSGPLASTVAPEPEPEEPDPEIKPLAVEIWLASLDADEFDRVIKRARRNR